MVNSFPEPNDWAEHVPQVPRLARPIQICKDRVPTLTTSNSYLFISDLQVAAKDDDREFFRFILPEERFTLQGFPKEIASSFSSTALQIKAAGNAYPVPLIAAAVHGLICKFGPLPHVKEALKEPAALCDRLDKVMYGDGPASSQKQPRPKGKGKRKAKKKPAASSRKDPMPSRSSAAQPAARASKGLAADNSVDRPARVLKRSASAMVQKAEKVPAKTASAWCLRGFLSSSSDSS